MTSDQTGPMSGDGVRAGLRLVPGIGGTVASLWDISQERDNWRVRQFGEAARNVVYDDDRFLARLVEDERLADMLFRGAASARATAWEAKRITMGRVIGQAIADGSDIDGYAALLSAFADLESPHFDLLKKVAGCPESYLVEMIIAEPYRSQLISQGTLKLDSLGSWDSPVRVRGATDFGLRLLDWLAGTDPVFEIEVVEADECVDAMRSI